MLRRLRSSGPLKLNCFWRFLIDFWWLLTGWSRVCIWLCESMVSRASELHFTMTLSTFVSNGSIFSVSHKGLHNALSANKVLDGRNMFDPWITAAKCSAPVAVCTFEAPDKRIARQVICELTCLAVVLHTATDPFCRTNSYRGRNASAYLHDGTSMLYKLYTTQTFEAF